MVSMNPHRGRTVSSGLERMQWAHRLFFRKQQIRNEEYVSSMISVITMIVAWNDSPNYAVCHWMLQWKQYEMKLQNLLNATDGNMIRIMVLEK
ncbi:unnamed protein product [Gongylonema pulchrum]|uniref:Uncharacterized protein n=1 Tax=Gongylonema pulchrum TaxID=637853 RepID=A0A3P6RS94_9BILA|nr:unnamed protein product [Gongylonema pulchrum]